MQIYINMSLSPLLWAYKSDYMNEWSTTMLSKFQEDHNEVLKIGQRGQIISIWHCQETTLTKIYAFRLEANNMLGVESPNPILKHHDVNILSMQDRKHNHKKNNTKSYVVQIWPTSMEHNEKISLHENKIIRRDLSISLLNYNS